MKTTAPTTQAKYAVYVKLGQDLEWQRWDDSVFDTQEDALSYIKHSVRAAETVWSKLHGIFIETRDRGYVPTHAEVALKDARNYRVVAIEEVVE